MYEDVGGGGGGRWKIGKVKGEGVKSVYRTKGLITPFRVRT